jgi:predicted DNA-binding protein (UPF0251 family)
MLEVVSLGHDELEALRLADFEGLYQADVAERMGVSRQTVGNILKEAHRKVAEALLQEKAIRVEGGPVVEWPEQGCPGRGRGRGRGRCGRGRSRELPDEPSKEQEAE